MTAMPFITFTREAAEWQGWDMGCSVHGRWGTIVLHPCTRVTRLSLPPGATSKAPPPLTMVSSSTRTTATVTPLVNQLSPSNASNAATNGNGRGSSFAAALRKLAKQAGDTEPGLVQQHPAPPPEGARSSDLSPTNLSTSGREPSSSITSAPTPKRMTSLPPAPRHSSPPVVTIAPSSHHHSNNYSASSSSNEHRKSLERPGTGSSSSGGHLEVKQEHKEERPKEHQHTTQHAPATSSAYEELAMRGFQPYRAGEDPSRQAAAFSAASAFPMDPALYSAYHSAFAAAPHPFSHPAFRFDDPMLLERYRMMQPPMYPYAAPPGMMHAPGLHSLLPPGVRYPADLLGQSPLHYLPGAKLPDHLSPGSADRVKVEDDLRREREKEEMEREREREREREIQKERERREKEERERQEKERRDRERRERQRLAERNAISRPQEDPGGGRYAPRDMSMYGMNHLEKRLYPYPTAPPPQPVVPPAPQKEDAEKERQLMHQQVRPSAEYARPHLCSSQFLREQDLMLRETNGPTVKNNQEALSSHNSHKESKPFHRPFEKTNAPNGFNKELLKVPEPPPQATEARNYFDKKQNRHRSQETGASKEGSHPEFTYRLNSSHHKQHKEGRSLDRPKTSEPRAERLKRPLLNGPPSLVNDSSLKVKNRSLTDMEGDAKRRKLSDAAAASVADHSSALDTQQLTKTSDYKKRLNFLNALGLQPVNSQRRIELDFIRDVCEWDRQKRNGPKEGIKVPRLSMDPLGLLAPGSTVPTEKNTAAKDSREFSREFHASVLQVTQQQQLKADEDATASSFKWPGIEALLEAYQRHSQEQGLEQHVLKEQCANLKSHQRQLNHTAEQLSSRISELIQHKQKLEGDRQRTQTSLDALKRPLRAVRR
ncbi:hypothetical protein CAPTEDRAFT_227025 [Capitella teleta]|uniref:Genetic suppressor element-like domain-containing protein n=1 Tax=Capitella teleta TaxID=283909 RepID=R7UIX1_CAPTE|nr:hypothetical protein CAPTEDRAFT_227025 [Capitella teleta]|eukprot:ELU03232.1 hypothetical protein CAPTEDRAFT_227025 [Capitella teleta]